MSATPAFAALSIEPFGARHDRSGFSCGQPSLDVYVRKQMGQDARRRMAAPFVIADAAGRILAFYTLAAASIRLAALPEEVTRRLPHYPAVPAVLLGRLGVTLGSQGQGLGRHLLADALLRAARSEIAAYALVVDPLDAAGQGFYEKEGFLPLRDEGARLYRRLEEIAAAFAER